MRRSDLALAGIACAAVPGMKPTTVREVSRRPVDGPPTHQTAIVEDSTGRTWVVRAPLSAVAGAELERNESLVSQLGKHLPFKAPAATGFASLGPDQPRAAVYPYVDGSALNFHGVPAGAGLASAIGRAVAAIHNIPRDVFEDHDVPVFDASAHRERQISELDRAAATGVVPTGLLARWEQAFEASALWRFSATPVHGALDGGAFLVAFADNDASTGRVLALTHWDQACVTDPAQDFAAMVDQMTPVAFDSVVESYSLARSSRPDPHLTQRARLAAEMRLINGLAQAVATHADDLVQSRIDELRKLDRLTAADSSLVPPTPPVEATPAPAFGAKPSPLGEPPEPQNSTDSPRAGTTGESMVDPESADIDVMEEDEERPVEVDHTSDGEFVSVQEASGSERARANVGPTVELEIRQPTSTPAAGESEGGSTVDDSQVDGSHVDGPRFDETDLDDEDDVPAIDLDDEDATESLPRVRLGEDLQESHRLHDLYDMPDEEADDGGDTQHDDVRVAGAGRPTRSEESSS